MRNCILFAVVIVCAVGCAGGKRVEGNTINFSVTKSIVVKSDFKNIGTFQEGFSGGVVHSNKSNDILVLNDMFAKFYKDTNEIVEAVVLYWAKPGNKVVWHPASRGTKEDKYFSLKSIPDSFKEHIKSGGYVISSGFSCVETNRVTEADVMKHVTYCVASSITPAGVNLNEYVMKKYNESTYVVQR